MLGVLAALIEPVAELLEPVMTLLNAIPRVVLAPLFIETPDDQPATEGTIATQQSQDLAQAP